jgi:hydrogenase nickel incorporation protein HypB
MANISVKVYKNIMSANETWAAKIRGLCAEKNVQLWNIIGSPGSGKTALLEALCPALETTTPCAVLEGDVETARDAERLAERGILARQIVTHGACHLGAEIIYRALVELPLETVRTVFVENVGNLVCPAEFDIGEHGKIAVLSVTEGEDKPLKYPLLFRLAGLAILTKIDLLPHLQVDITLYRENIRNINNTADIREVSTVDGTGIKDLVARFQAAKG